MTPDENGLCSFTVLPYENKVGSATITVKVADLDGGEDSDTFELTVTPVNDAPKAGNDTFTVAENATYTADVLANDDAGHPTGQRQRRTDHTVQHTAGIWHRPPSLTTRSTMYRKSDRDTSVDYYDNLYLYNAG